MPTLSTANGVQVAKRRLQTLADNLGDLDLEQEVDQAALLLQGELSGLPDYRLLPEAEQGYYDVATGLSGASALLMPAILKANDGLAKLKTPEFEYTFTVPSAADRQDWAAKVAQAVELLARYVRSLNPPRQKSTFSMFGAAGVARARQREWAAFDTGGYLGHFFPAGW